MLQKIIQYISPSQQQQTQEETISKRQQKILQMERIVELNEYFQYPQILKDDAKLLINQFSNDKIDIYITEQQESILQIHGYIEILLKQKSFELLLNFSFYYAYPYQICIISIDNKSLKDRSIKINTYYSKSSSLEQIILNDYLQSTNQWLSNKDLKIIIEELKILLTKQFPYIKVRKQQDFFQNQPNDVINSQEQKEIPIPKQDDSSQTQINQDTKKNIIRAPIVPKSNNLIGPTGLLLEEENQLQSLTTNIIIKYIKQIRNDIVAQKNYRDQMKVYKQQQIGLQHQLIYINQKLDYDLLNQSQRLMLIQQAIEIIKKNTTNDILDLLQLDDLSTQIIDLISEKKASKDCYSILANSFKKGNIEQHQQQQNKNFRSNYY